MSDCACECTFVDLFKPYRVNQREGVGRYQRETDEERGKKEVQNEMMVILIVMSANCSNHSYLFGNTTGVLKQGRYHIYLPAYNLIIVDNIS